MLKVIALRLERRRIIAHQIEFVPHKIEQIRQSGGSGRASPHRCDARARRSTSGARSRWIRPRDGWGLRWPTRNAYIARSSRTTTAAGTSARSRRRAS